MNEVIEFLKENPVQYFATVGLDNKAKVRPFQFMIEDGGKLYFCTNNEKDVFKQIKNNPYVEVCVSNSKFHWMRLNGKVKFSNDIDIKKTVIEGAVNNNVIKFLEDKLGSVNVNEDKIRENFNLSTLSTNLLIIFINRF